VGLQRTHVAFISRCFVIISESSSRPSVLSSVPPLSLSHTFLVIKGFEYLIYSCSPRGPLPLVISSFYLDLGPSILLLFFPFFGCFVLVTIGKFSSFITGSIFKLKTFFARSRTSHPDGGHFYET
jgi:hypothetical protein